MSLSLHTNYAELLTQSNLTKNSRQLDVAMERLSTGFRINSAKDDAAGLQVANRMASQISGQNIAQRNALDAQSLMSTAEGSLSTLTDIGGRMKDLATQSSNGTYGTAERAAMQSEYAELSTEFERILTETSYAGTKLFDRTEGVMTGAMSFQIGASSTEKLDFDVSSSIAALNDASDQTNNVNLSAATGKTFGITTDGGTTFQAVTLDDNKMMFDGTSKIEYVHSDGKAYDLYETSGGGGSEVLAVVGDLSIDGGTTGATAQDITDTLEKGFGNVLSQNSASNAIDTMSAILDGVSATSSTLGANVNRLDHTMNNLSSMSTNLQASLGRIKDADFAQETAVLSRQQMLMQAGTSVISTARGVSSMAMSLLR